LISRQLRHGIRGYAVCICASVAYNKKPRHAAGASGFLVGDTRFEPASRSPTRVLELSCRQSGGSSVGRNITFSLPDGLSLPKEERPTFKETSLDGYPVDSGRFQNSTTLFPPCIRRRISESGALFDPDANTVQHPSPALGATSVGPLPYNGNRIIVTRRGSPCAIR
jgi:hypothetical protein